MSGIHPADSARAESKTCHAAVQRLKAAQIYNIPEFMEQYHGRDTDIFHH